MRKKTDEDVVREIRHILYHQSWERKTFQETIPTCKLLC
jgi:hypothetical protein